MGLSIAPGWAMKVRTSNKKYNVDPPYFSRERNNNPISVPNVDSGGLHKLREGYSEGVHAKHDQERRGIEGQVS